MIVLIAEALAAISSAALLWSLSVIVEVTIVARRFRKLADQSLCDLTYRDRFTAAGDDPVFHATTISTEGQR